MHIDSSRIPETIVVDRIEDGRPVFTGETFGYKLEIVEGRLGTVVSTRACHDHVPPVLLEPPPAPNQCSWHLCYPP